MTKPEELDGALPELVQPGHIPTLTRAQWRTIHNALAAEFPDVQYRVGATTQRKQNGRYPTGTRGQLLAYIDARQVSDRLDDTVGAGFWHDSYEVIDAASKVVRCSLTVLGITKTDVGYPNAANEDDSKEPFKASFSDAFKRAGVKWSIGRYLYDLEPEWVDIDEWGRPLRNARRRSE